MVIVQVQEMVIVFGIEGCEWCRKARILLQESGIFHCYVNVRNGPEFLDVVSPNERTFPRIFVTEAKSVGDFEYPSIGSRLIGGYSDLLRELIEGKLN